MDNEHIEAHVSMWPIFVVLLVGLWLLENYNPFLFALIFYWFGLIIEPNIAQFKILVSERHMFRTWILAPFVLWSAAYAWVISKAGGYHSKWSHCPGLSTAIRIVWFILPVHIGWMYLLHYIADKTHWFYFWPSSLVIWVHLYIALWIGLTLSDLVYWIKDHVYRQQQNW